MSLFLAQLLVGLALLLLGGALVADTTLIRAGLRALPRSAAASYVLFGAAAAWFVLLVLNMSDADLIVPAPKSYYAAAFALLAVLAFFNVTEFLAVRGLAALILIAAGPLLAAGFGHYGLALVYKVAVYLALSAALWLAGQPWRLRDAIDWLQRVPGRARVVGTTFAAAGLVIVGVAFAA
jgi:hypothetical protein